MNYECRKKGKGEVNENIFINFKAVTLLNLSLRIKNLALT